MSAGWMLLCGSLALAAGPFHPYKEHELPAPPAFANAGADSTAREHRENPRVVSSVLAVFLGPFGAHRLYLGTTPKVAVVYGLTFGGFGLLPLLDLGHLLFSKDLDRYRNNDKVFMWNAPRSTEGTTPP